MKKQRKNAAGQAAHADVYQIVTDRIIAALEQGTAPWRRPWRCVDTGDPGGLPSNALTGRCYSGVNVLLLWLAAEEGGYTSDRWLTYRQAQEAGGQVRKGESCSLAVIYKDWTKPAEDEHGNRLYDTDGRLLTETVPMLRQLHLFNVAQCDGLPEHMQPPQADDDTKRPVEDYAVLSPERLADVQRMLEATGVQTEAR
ncbi:ArdC family protein, partial [Salmonella enterica]|nr:ArdC family protein [Salmonella enterica]